MKSLINDKYRRSRGGQATLLSLKCSHCGQIICTYQKDGPGTLKRIYFDRIKGFKPSTTKTLTCPNCNETLGIPIVYKKENRNSYRLFVGAISKHIIK